MFSILCKDGTVPVWQAVVAMHTTFWAGHCKLVTRKILVMVKRSTSKRKFTR